MSKLRVIAKHWWPVLAWMALIFYASGDARSIYHSSRIIKPLLLGDVQADRFEPIVKFARKSAHCLEYAVLALLFWRALRAQTAQPYGWSWRVARNTMLCVVAYGITDEVHQIFVPTRTAEVRDVLFDAIGGAVGLLALWIVGRWRKWW